MDVSDTFAASRRSLHGVAELLLAGPQHAACAKIRLRPVAGGFGTCHAPDIRVEGTAVVAGDRHAEIDGRSARELAEDLGIAACTLTHVYREGSGVGLDDRLAVSAPDADQVARTYASGDAALRALAPDQTPILWPEHFDLGITLDEVNYGVSPGDAALAAPYMYVGPWRPPPVDDFWNQPFGAARDLPGSVDEVVAFFVESRRRLS
ncbi:MAG: hypothetical protein JF565_01305 [Propionibacteriales bacterium]|nr:hypothetical protein [Propionibacteriales bacterium]